MWRRRTVDNDVKVYKIGLVHASVCAPRTITPADVAQAVSRLHPTGLDHGWKISAEPFSSSDSNPVACNTEPGGRVHYLLEC
jgi:hypothetical protein